MEAFLNEIFEMKMKTRISVCDGPVQKKMDWSSTV